jgi:lipoic acid synthetase
VEKHNASSPGPFSKSGEGETCLPLDIYEPEKVAEAAEKLGLKYVVITSVTRDDLPDGGAEQFARTILAVREKIPEALVEVLIPDFNGDLDSIKIVLNARPDVLNHNVETIERLYNEVRPQASFERSLKVLTHPLTPSLEKRGGSSILYKTGFMVGLGETKEEVFELLKILKETGVDIVTIGQYIAPSKEHYPVKEFITPEMFEEYKKYGESIGIPQVFAGPFVRSSYRAGEVAAKCGTKTIYKR